MQSLATASIPLRQKGEKRSLSNVLEHGKGERRAGEKVGIDWRSRNGDYLGSTDQKRLAKTAPVVLADTNSPFPASTNTC